MNKLINKYKIFGRKKGRKKFQYVNYNFNKKYLLNLDSDFNNKKVVLDIGSGYGENALVLAQKFPEKLIIACEIYEDGNINLCNQLTKKNINNVKIFNQNVLILLENTNLKFLLDEIWILFPDPWPKKKHNKRRLINDTFFKIVYSKLIFSGAIIIVTDSISYFISILNYVYKSKVFKWINDRAKDWQYSNTNLIKTKYYKKALNYNRKPMIIILSKI